MLRSKSSVHFSEALNTSLRKWDPPLGFWLQNKLKTLVVWLCLPGRLQYEPGLLNSIKWMQLCNKTNSTCCWKTSIKSPWRNYLLFFGKDSFGTDCHRKLMPFWTSVSVLWLQLHFEINIHPLYMLLIWCVICILSVFFCCKEGSCLIGKVLDWCFWYIV